MLMTCMNPNTVLTLIVLQTNILSMSCDSFERPDLEVLIQPSQKKTISKKVIPTEDGPKLSAPHSKIRHTEGD